MNAGATESSVAPPNMASLSPRWACVLPALLVVMVVVIHAARLSALPLRGEESRRARIAVEMAESGDWIVPRQQGEPFLSRPPLQNWIIALFGLFRGEVDLWAVRLPSVLAVASTALLVYWYARRFLSPIGAFSAGLALATFGQVLELGSLGETESLFMFVVSASILLWHGLRQTGYSPWVYWPIAYAMVSLGGLAKGIQSPVFFGLAIGAFLLVRGEWRELFSWPHVIGGGLALATVWGPWQVLFWQAEGWQAVRGIYGGDVAMRFERLDLLAFSSHLALFPLEVFFGCLVPWSLLLIALLSRSFRNSDDGSRPYVVFLVIAIAATFPTCWLPPGARGRYFMPLYPCIAILVGLVVERSAAALPFIDNDALRRRPLAWRLFLGAAAVLAILGAAALLVAASTIIGLAACLVFAATAVPLAGIAYWASRSIRPWSAVFGAAAVGLIAAMLWNGPIVQWKLALSEQETAEAVARVRSLLPAEAQLVSIGPTDHLFAFYYRAPIRLIRWDRLDKEQFEYFCYSTQFSESPPMSELPFSFEVLAVVSCERQESENPKRVVVVAKRRNEAELRNGQNGRRHNSAADCVERATRLLSVLCGFIEPNRANVDQGRNKLCRIQVYLGRHGSGLPPEIAAPACSG